MTRRESPTWKAMHRRILDGALAEVFAHGAVKARMERIAERVKVSKVTIYNHFQTKDALLRAAADRYLEELEQSGVLAPPRPVAAPPREALLTHAQALLRALASPRHLGMVRLARCAAALPIRRFPAESQLLPQTDGLAAFLREETTNGRLAAGDADTAARQFYGLLLAPTIYEALQGQKVDLGDAALARAAEDAVATFFARYGRPS
jgi:TetR/AcrR family transcriptional regulator of autoinduction and epiphytic fitness